jgi:hypothetical protein
VEFAALKGTTIARVVDTLMRADHRSGGRELAARTGAAYYLHEAADAAFAFTPLADGQELICANVVTRVLHTPDHTPESLCLLVTDKRRGAGAMVRVDGRHALRAPSDVPTCAARPRPALAPCTGTFFGCSCYPTIPRSTGPTSRAQPAGTG